MRGGVPFCSVGVRKRSFVESETSDTAVNWCDAEGTSSATGATERLRVGVGRGVGLGRSLKSDLRIGRFGTRF